MRRRISVSIIMNALSPIKQEDKLSEQNDMSLIVEVWGLDEQAFKGISRANNINRLKHGLMAQVPIVCYGDGCPYISTCYLTSDERPREGRCPIEISTIVNLFDKYCQHLEITEEDVVDLTLIKELIDIDIQLLRADHYMAAHPSFVEDVPAFMTDSGYTVMKPELTKATEYKDRLRRERHRILQLLNSTRRDRSGGKTATDPSTIAAEVLAKAKELGLHTVIDVTNYRKEGDEKDG